MEAAAQILQENKIEKLPVVDKDGKLKDQIWLDVGRLKLISKEPVMARPNYDFGPQAEGKQGAAEKPAHYKA